MLRTCEAPSLLKVRMPKPKRDRPPASFYQVAKAFFWAIYIAAGVSGDGCNFLGGQKKTDIRHCYQRNGPWCLPFALLHLRSAVRARAPKSRHRQYPSVLLYCKWSDAFSSKSVIHTSGKHYPKALNFIIYPRL